MWPVCLAGVQHADPAVITGFIVVFVDGGYDRYPSQRDSRGGHGAVARGQHVYPVLPLTDGSRVPWADDGI